MHIDVGMIDIVSMVGMVGMVGVVSIVGMGRGLVTLVLYDWQAECLEQWEKNNYRGIVKAVTGSGKTMLALNAIRRLEESLYLELRVKIVVPQIFLADQWKEEVKNGLGAPAADIGMYRGDRKELARKYMIYVVNSARYSLARHIIADQKAGFAVFLIADECHHYSSAENNRIFDFNKMAVSGAQYFALGLSATPEVANYSAITTPIGPEIYTYGFKKALNDGIISKFILFSIRLNFNSGERDIYADLCDRLSMCYAQLYHTHPELKGMAPVRFFISLNKLATRGEGNIASTARNALALMYKRKTLCHMAAERPMCVLAIIKALPAHTRILLFCERIHSAELLHKNISEQYPGQAGLYHSKMADSMRLDMLECYKRGDLRMLVCCRALDEGLNIPSTDAGIIVSSSMSARQRVQRLGRMLRQSVDFKRIYYLYVGDSVEDGDPTYGLRVAGADVPVITLRYRDGAFVHTEYEDLRNHVRDYVLSKKLDIGLMGALDKNMSLALLRGDFMLSEQRCRDNHQKSRSVQERNYWASVLHIILARRKNHTGRKPM